MTRDAWEGLSPPYSTYSAGDTRPKTPLPYSAMAFGDLVERVSPGPYVELFARAPRLGWDSWGKGYESSAPSRPVVDVPIDSFGEGVA